MFFRKSRLALQEKYVIEFNDAAVAENPRLKAASSQPPGVRKAPGTDALQRLLRDNVAQVRVSPCLVSLSARHRGGHRGGPALHRPWLVSFLVTGCRMW
jgi:hypothetical protein